jgi:glycosyltransferase involved in cell wall biosynthesis
LRLPPIAFDVGGVSEIIETGRNGLLVRSADTKAFAAAHESLLDPAARAHLASNGPNRAALFSVKAMTEGVERVYQRILTT